jgi:G3E family GTPase
MLMGADLGRKWGPDEKKSTKMVFIGRKLPKELFIKGLTKCLAR